MKNCFELMIMDNLLSLIKLNVCFLKIFSDVINSFVLSKEKEHKFFFQDIFLIMLVFVLLKDKSQSIVQSRLFEQQIAFFFHMYNILEE